MPQPACFLIADISGYTGYLAEVELDHAHDILADLMSSVVTSLRPGFRLAKLEGDAAFTFARGEEFDGTMLLDTIERCYFAFRRRRRDVRQASSCTCDACSRIPELNLKFVVHHGTAIEQKVAGRRELVGADVIVVHRLLKNEVVEKLELGAYALFTQQCAGAAGIDPAALGMTPITETYDRVGEVQCWAHDLERRWQEEEARARVFVAPDESVLAMSVHANVPAQVAWEFLTTPGRRKSWQIGVTDVQVTETTGGRRGLGSVNHCMHGKDAVIEEILDWRPYHYLTDRTTFMDQSGPVKILHTIELEPGAEGTTIHFRFGAPKSTREKAVMNDFAPHYGEGFRATFATLTAQLSAAFAAHGSDDLAEPALPDPSPDGPLSALQREGAFG